MGYDFRDHDEIVTTDEEIVKLKEAFARGEEINVLSFLAGQWSICKEPDFDPTYHWRVKPDGVRVDPIHKGFYYS